MEFALRAWLSLCPFPQIRCALLLSGQGRGNNTISFWPLCPPASSLPGPRFRSCSLPDRPLWGTAMLPFPAVLRGCWWVHYPLTLLTLGGTLGSFLLDFKLPEERFSYSSSSKPRASARPWLLGAPPGGCSPPASTCCSVSWVEEEFQAAEPPTLYAPVRSDPAAAQTERIPPAFDCTPGPGQDAAAPEGSLRLRLRAPMQKEVLSHARQCPASREPPPGPGGRCFLLTILSPVPSFPSWRTAASRAPYLFPEACLQYLAFPPTFEEASPSPVSLPISLQARVLSAPDSQPKGPGWGWWRNSIRVLIMTRRTGLGGFGNVGEL